MPSSPNNFPSRVDVARVAKLIPCGGAEQAQSRYRESLADFGAVLSQAVQNFITSYAQSCKIYLSLS